MARSGRHAVALALVLLMAGCHGAASESFEVTPAPLPADESPIRPGERAVVDFVNDRGKPHAVAVTVVEGDIPLLEVLWTNGTATAIKTDSAGRETIWQRAAQGDIRDLGLPDGIKSSFARAAAEPGGTAMVYLRAGTQNPTVLIEVRPIDGEDRSAGDREPLMLATVFDCQRTEQFGSIHIALGSSVDVDRSHVCAQTR